MQNEKTPRWLEYGDTAQSFFLTGLFVQGVLLELPNGTQLQVTQEPATKQRWGETFFDIGGAYLFLDSIIQRYARETE